jgi:16S rRNA (cytosine967-C5)-methyltransferase
MKISPARIAAYDILFKIERERAYSSDQLAKAETKLGPQDRALCHEIVLGVLRRQLLLDRYIDLLSKKPRLDIEVRIILRAGLFQLYFLDRVPDHANVNDSVALVQRARKSSARGLVNAVLRSAARQRPVLSFDREIERISIETSHPIWLLEHLGNQFDLETVERVANSNNELPKIAFRRTAKGENAKLPSEIVESSDVRGCFVASTFSQELRYMADSGEIYFQDEASQMAAASLDLQPGEKFLDVCASPGGKTTAVAANLPDTGLIVAGDLTWRRVQLLSKTCKMQGACRVEIVQYDAANSLPFEDALFDHVLVDAPCTGTGTIRHNPEIRYFVGPEDFVRMQKTQIAILANASKLVRPGGKLTYSTCSMEAEENEDVCDLFLSNSLDWRTIEPNVPERFWTDQRFARTYPYRDGMDGFFIATFQRS